MSAHPVPQTTPLASKDRWLGPWCALALMLWFVLLLFLGYAGPEFHALFAARGIEPTFLARVVLGLRGVLALAALTSIVLVAISAAYALQHRTAAVWLTVLASVLGAGIYFVLQIPFWDMERQPQDVKVLGDEGQK